MNNKRRLPTNITKQSGVVLVVSLVFLAALTAVTAALMQNSTADMKMSGASEEKTVAELEAYSGVDELIFNQVNSASNNFALPPTGNNYPVVNQDVLLPDTNTSTTGVITAVNNGFNLDVSCPRMAKASSEGTYGCSLLNVTVTRNYGRNGNSNIVVLTGIQQQIPK